MFILNHRAKYYLFLWQFLILLFPNSITAQILPQTTGTTRDAEPFFEESESPLEVSPPLSIPQPSLVEITELNNISKIEITGSTIFSQEELESVLKSFQDRDISPRELQEVISIINKLYSDHGYITSGVFTNPQVQDNSIVTIQVTEGKIAGIIITGLTRLESHYVSSRLDVDREKPFNKNQVQEALQLLQNDYLIEKISAKITTGSSIGKNILEVEVAESDHFYTELSIDNLGSPVIGSSRRRLQFNHDNLLGFGDRFYASYTNTEGSNVIDGIDYIIPVNSNDGKLGFSYSYGKAEIVEEPFDVLDIEARSSRFLVSYRQPIYKTSTQEFALGVTFDRTNTETKLLNTPFPVIRGASSEGKLNISALRFSQDYIGRSKQDWFGLRSEFSLGVDVFDDTTNDDRPDTHFFLWRGQTWYQRKLTPDITLSFKSYLQLADRPLVSSEQTLDELFTLNREEGTFILRGYRQNSLTADNGVFASAELRASIVQIPQWQTKLQITPFVDFGTVWNDDDVEIDESTLTSVGLGLRLLVGDSFRARVDWGIPLVDQDTIGDSLQEDRITFNLEYRPF
ncbi:MAG: ShlB/FhaC/HecB family hemolysin secretion/activation protein [Cyanobacteria bacterium P01_F01_bin.143]